MTPTPRTRRARAVWGSIAGGALVELLLLAAWIAANDDLLAAYLRAERAAAHG